MSTFLRVAKCFFFLHWRAGRCDREPVCRLTAANTVLAATALQQLRLIVLVLYILKLVELIRVSE